MTSAVVYPRAAPTALLLDKQMTLSILQRARYQGSSQRVPVGLVAAQWTGPLTQAQRRQLLQQAMAVCGVGTPLPPVQLPSGSAPEAEGVCLSLSHSGSVVVAAAVPGGSDKASKDTAAVALGVDVEQWRERQFQRLDRFLGWSEPSADLAHFYRRWTLAEALLKALGGPHAKATFDTLDYAVESRVKDPGERRARHAGWDYRVMWPQLADEQTACWLLATRGQAE